MSKLRLFVCLAAFAAFTLALSAAASAQAVRTWVSGTGDDTFPCSRTAPCRTFAGAISKTRTDGEINILDSGSYGTLTITKSLTVDGGGMFAGTTASSVSGFTVNLTSTAASDPLHKVVLRNLSINGTGTCIAPCIGTRTGLDGIRIVNAGVAPNPTVIVENVTIENFTQSGIDWSASGGTLIVRDSRIRNNTLEGVKVDAASGTVRVSISNTSADFNSEGFRFNDNVRATIVNSQATNNTLNGFTCFPDGQGNSEMNVDSSDSSNNLQWGIVAAGNGGATCTARVSDSVVANNVVSGFQINAGGTLLSTGRNRVTAPTMAPTGPFTEQ